MRKTFSERGFEDYVYWQTQDKKILKLSKFCSVKVITTINKIFFKPSGLFFLQDFIFFKRKIFTEVIALNVKNFVKTWKNRG